MTEERKVKVGFNGRFIVVTLPGTSFQASYVKSSDAPGLTQSFMTDDTRAAISRDEFLALACRAANDKARELGWLV